MVNTYAPALAPAMFRPDDAVRMLGCHDDVPAGSVGRVLGRFPRSIGTTYVVSFVDETIRVLELCSDEIDLVYDFRVPA